MDRLTSTDATRSNLMQRDAMSNITAHLRSLPERQIPNLVQVFIAATMAADALDGLNEDWVTETTREMRVAVMYGILPLANASNDEIVEAIKQLENAHEAHHA